MLYASGNGIIVEELLPYPLEQAVLAASLVEKGILFVGVADYFNILLSQGFKPMAPDRDLFSHGLDVVPVDFGQDLGDPGQSVDAAYFQGILDCMLEDKFSDLSSDTKIQAMRILGMKRRVEINGSDFSRDKCSR